MSSVLRRLPYLDGLRGAAALLVMFAHYILAFQPSLYYGRPPEAGAPWFAAGSWIASTPLVLLFSPQMGVAVFFVLSGFVLAASVAAKPALLAELAVRRWIRLSGPVLLTTLPIWWWLSSGWHPDTVLAARNHSQWLGMNYTWVAWQANELRLAVYQAVIDVYARDNHHWWNSSLWTIRIELWGSLALFAAYAAARAGMLRRRWRAAAAAAAACLLWRNDFAGFALGALMFELHPAFTRLAAWPRAASALGVPVLAVALLLGGAPVYVTRWPYVPVCIWLQTWTADPTLLLHRLGAALLVAVVLFWRPLQALLVTRAFSFLGRVSFMLYLCHVTLICTLASWLVLRLMPLAGYNAACALALPPLLAVALAVAALGTRWMDQPCIRLAHRAGHWTSGWLRIGHRSRAVRRA